MSKGPTNSKLSTSAPPGSYSLKRTFSKPDGPTFECVNTSGTGTFGVVYKAVNSSNGEIVAIKRVLQDMRYKVCRAQLNLAHRLTGFRTVNWKL